MKKNLLYKLIILFVVIIGSLFFFSLYVFYNSQILSSLQIEGMWSITIFILIRISITVGMTLFAFQKWFKQEDLKFSNVDFLFGVFFLGLVFGKMINLLYILVYFNVIQATLLFLLKIRFILIILTSAPLIFLGINLISLSLSKNREIIANNLRIRNCFLILIIIIIIQSLFVIFAPNIAILNNILIVIHTLSLVWITASFYYAYKKKLISQINPLIIAIVLLLDLILYLITRIFSSLRQTNIGFSPSFVIFAELIDLIIIIVIFIGYYTKISYLSIEN